MRRTTRFLGLAGALLWSRFLAPAADRPHLSPPPPGRLVDLGGHRLHVDCRGAGSPVVVVENGLGDFSFDWILVQSRVAAFTRVCTYDRAGYAWSDPGPMPRSFAQLNLELRDALARMGERGPFVLVGHSFGGPVVRNFALAYPSDVAGMVLVDASFEGQWVGIGGKRMMRLGTGAKARAVAPPREEISRPDAATPVPTISGPDQKLDALYDRLPPAIQKLQLWAQARPEIEAAENSQREWSEEYFAKWLETPQAGTLGAMPLVVLARAEGGYGNDLQLSASQLESARREGQAKLARLSTSGKLTFIASGHNMEITAPDAVAGAIEGVVRDVRKSSAKSPAKRGQVPR